MLAHPDATFDAPDAWENRAAALSLTQETPAGLLFTSDSNIVTTPEMRVVSASAKYNSHFVAVALVSSSMTMKILGNFYLRINRPTVPTRFFSMRESGELWLTTQLQAAQVQDLRKVV